MSGGALSEDEISVRWPLHCLVWKDDHRALKRLLEDTDSPHDLELLDPRGRTPLHLAVTLNRVTCASLLLHHNANSLADNRHRWSVLNEATCTGNPELIGLVMRFRDQRQQQIKTRDIPLMLEQLEKAPDFYMEMKWEFSSWLPFVSRMCPSDTCQIWKKGTTVRVDTTLIGFEKLSWQRGHQTLIFQATPSGHRVCDINHDDRTVWEKEFEVTVPDPVQTMMSQEMGVLHRMSSPVVSTYIKTDSIVFQRQRSGIWGFRSDKTEDVDGYQAKVFGSTGLEIVTETRVEHLPETEKHKQRSINPLQDFLGAAQDHASSTPAIEAAAPPPKVPAKSQSSPAVQPRLTMEQYFTKPSNKEEYDAISRPPEVHTRVQKLKATVSLAENFPLSLQDQIMPIIDLMALNTPHFAKVKEFINMQMPSGFPIKLEIPLFHVISAKVSFSNVNGHITPVPHVSLSSMRKKAGPTPLLTPAPSSIQVGGVKRRHGQAEREETSVDPPPQESLGEVGHFGDSQNEEVEICTISDECFAIPSGYRQLYGGGHGNVNQEEELIQLAIQQSLMEHQQQAQDMKEGDTLTLQEALKDVSMKVAANSHANHGHQTNLSLVPPIGGGSHLSAEEELELVLALSREMALEEERKRMAVDDDEELERILKMSLEDT